MAEMTAKREGELPENYIEIARADDRPRRRSRLLEPCTAAGADGLIGMCRLGATEVDGWLASLQ
jgi:hypothetical protein